jgi:hypothetical protein
MSLGSDGIKSYCIIAVNLMRGREHYAAHDNPMMKKIFEIYKDEFKHRGSLFYEMWIRVLAFVLDDYQIEWDRKSLEMYCCPSFFSYKSIANIYMDSVVFRKGNCGKANLDEFKNGDINKKISATKAIRTMRQNKYLSVH